jgi:flagellin-like protein
MKGISPLIASVLLIAFTMAIAGIMATWATTFSRERLTGAGEEADCIGALDLSSLSFSNGVVTVKIRNVSNNLNLTGLKAYLEYTSSAKNKEYSLKDYNVTDSLPPASTAFFIVDTGDATKPKQIEISAANCAKEPSILLFR